MKLFNYIIYELYIKIKKCNLFNYNFNAKEIVVFKHCKIFRNNIVN